MDAELRVCLENCNLSDAQINVIRDEGYLTLEDFALNTYQDITDFAKRVQALPLNRGGVWFGQVHIIKLKGFLYWLKDCQQRDLPLDLDDRGFGNEQLMKCVAEYKSETEKKDDNAKAKIPDKFQPHTLRGWNTFTRELHKYLSSIVGATGVLLVYVIRKDPPDPNTPAPQTPKQFLIAQAPLRGAAYIKDHQRVYSIILDAVSGSDSWTWIRDVKDEDGRTAMLKLRDHYDRAGSRT